MKLLQVRVDPCGLTAQPFLVKPLTATTHMEITRTPANSLLRVYKHILYICATGRGYPTHKFTI